MAGFVFASIAPSCLRGRGSGLARMYKRAARRTKLSNQNLLQAQGAKRPNTELPKSETPVAGRSLFQCFSLPMAWQKGMSAAPAPPGMSEAQSLGTWFRLGCMWGLYKAFMMHSISTSGSYQV